MSVTSSVARSTQSGYTESDVAEFIAKGNRAGTYTGKEHAKRPTKKSRSQITEIVSGSGFLGLGEGTKSVFTSGERGAFSNKSDAEIQKMMKAFEKRRATIKERRARPGSSQTRLMNG